MGKISKKLIVICGQTATGKTGLAVYISKIYKHINIPPIEIISADSRQVYKGLDIGTGKDHPNDTVIWGIDLVDPKDEFSVSQYQKYARGKIEKIWKRNHLPILVGGTGFYIKAVVDGIDTIKIPKNDKLREELLGKTAQELYESLLLINPKKALSLNNSDKNNPARLIRSIEVTKSAKSKVKDEPLKADMLFIGLELGREILNADIKLRVKKRLQQGFDKEVDSLLSNGVNWSDQSMNTLGYKQWRDYKQGIKSIDEAIAEWTLQEQKYAKRQLTWFKKDKRIHWFKRFEPTLLKEVENLVETWHNMK